MSEVEREQLCAAALVPAAMSSSVAGYEWARDTIGQSGGVVYRLHGKPGAPDLFLKHGKDVVADDVSDEMARLQWLAAYLPVPAIRQFVRTSDQAWLLMTAMPGHTAYPGERMPVQQRSCFPTGTCTNANRLWLGRGR